MRSVSSHSGAATCSPDAIEPSLAARLFLALAVVLTALWVWARTSWYLAIDQFGYLTFARDLAAGHVFHDWPLLPAIGWLLPRGLDVDVLSQTYVLSSHGLYCRYAPGFPIVLAAVGRVLGEAAEHGVNVAALVLLLLASFALARRVLRSEWLALAHALLIVLLPNYVLLWSVSPLRDVPAHLAALSGLAALLGAGRARYRRLCALAAGGLMGYAVAIRIDAVLYLVPATALAVAVLRLRGLRLAAAIAGAAIGVSPLLAYDWIATGNPLRPTQVMELREVVSRDDLRGGMGRLAAVPALVREARAAEAATASPNAGPPGERGPSGGAGEMSRAASNPNAVPTPDAARRGVQGGGVRLRNFRATLPGNVAWIGSALGALGSALLVVGALAALGRAEILCTAVAYPVVAVLFFSLWSRPDPRYIAGALLLAPLLVLYGAARVVEWPAAIRARSGTAFAALCAVALGAVVVGLVVRQGFTAATALPWLSAALAVAIAVGLAAGLRGGAGAGAVAFRIAAGVLLSAVLLWRFALGAGSRATFQQPEVERARETVASVFAPRSVVFTSDEIGRPAENLGYYTHVSALYFSEVARWGQPWGLLVRSLLRAGWAVYVLLPPSEARTRLAVVSNWFETEVVAEISAPDALRFFVASPHHRGLPLVLLRVTREKPPALNPEASRAGDR